FVENPRVATGIALGTGQTFAAALDHGFETLHRVEINRGVIDISSRWFKEANRGLLHNPHVRVHRDDGRAFLRQTEEKSDLIVLEPLQAWTAGTTNLYARDFYEEVKQALVDHGVVAQWIPFYGQGPEETKSMVQTALDVFPNGFLFMDGV